MMPQMFRWAAAAMILAALGSWARDEDGGKCEGKACLAHTLESHNLATGWKVRGRDVFHQLI